MTSELGASLLSHVPEIQRARGFRLYTRDNRRILDLYQEGGRAVLGHRPGKLVHDVKNVLERGVLSAFQSRERARAARHVKALFPTIAASSQESELAVRFFHADRCRRSGGDSLVDLARPLVAEQSTGNAAAPVPLWRPWLPHERQQRAGELFARSGSMVVQLPLPSLFAVETRLYAPTHAPVPPGDPVAEPALKAVSVVSVLLAAAEPPQASVPLGFLACGPYLWMHDHAQLSTTEYTRRFSEFLHHGILISPDPALPSILPGELSPGEQKLLMNSAAQIMGESNGH